MVGTQGSARQVRELIDALQTVDDQGPALERLMTPVRELLGAEKSIAYRIVGEAGTFGLGFLYGDGVDLPLARSVFEPYVRAVPGFGLYNPARPEPSQRNRVLQMRQLLPGGKKVPVQQEIYPRFGLAGRDQLRVVVCQGEGLLAWVGAFREEPFGDEEALRLEQLVPYLRQRLFLEQQLEQQRLSAATLEAVLEALPLPSLLIDRKGRVESANLAARDWLDKEGLSARHRLLDAVQGRSPAGISLAPIGLTGVVRGFIATVQPGGALSAERVLRAGRALGLTRRQTEVLGQLAQGASNKSIALALQCAVKTVELHVSAVLAKAKVASRAELLARLAADSLPGR